MDKKTLLEALKRGKDLLLTAEEVEAAPKTSGFFGYRGKEYFICYAVAEGVRHANRLHLADEVYEAVQNLLAPYMIDSQGESWTFYSGVLRADAQREGRIVTDSEVQQARHRLLDSLIRQLENELSQPLKGSHETHPDRHCGNDGPDGPRSNA